MNCEACGVEINKELIEMLDKYQVPFRCGTCNSLKFPYKATRDIVFIWPEPINDRVGSIILPIMVKDSKEPEYGVVLSVGKGYWKKGGNFIPTNIKVGDEVIYDKSTPWCLFVEGPKERKYRVKYMGYQDVKALVTQDN